MTLCGCGVSRRSALSAGLDAWSSAADAVPGWAGSTSRVRAGAIATRSAFARVSHQARRTSGRVSAPALEGTRACLSTFLATMVPPSARVSTWGLSG